MNARLRLIAICSLSIVVWGCDFGEGEDVLDTVTSIASDVIQLDGYTVEYLRDNNLETFTYRVTGSGDAANLNYVFIETACAEEPVALSPSNAVNPSINTEADTTLAGVQWNQGLGEGGSRTYAMTFAEPQEEGAVTVVIRAGNTVQSALIAGACGNLFDLSGSVFVNDGDDDGSTREAGELGIENVQVDIIGDAGDTTSVVTGPDGQFSARLLRGTYTVEVPSSATVEVSSSATEGLFNETLEASYDPADGEPKARRTVELQSDVSGTDLGFDLDRQKTLDELTIGTRATDAEEVKVWKRWVDKTGRGQTTASGITPDMMSVILDKIFASPDEEEEGYFGNENPYTLADGEDPFEKASAILGTRLNNRSTDAEILYVETFAVELNIFAGLGSGDDDYDFNLGKHFETQLAFTPAARTSRSGAEAGSEALVSALVVSSLDTEIARAFNGGGGGGEVGD